jgi:hypothetical protein
VHDSDVPELREDAAAGLVDLLGYAPPSGQSVVSVEPGNVGVEARGGMRDEASLGDDEADSAFGAAAIIGRNIGSRHAAGGAGAGHGRHHDSIRERYSIKTERLKEGGRGTGHLNLVRYTEYFVSEAYRFRVYRVVTE